MKPQQRITSARQKHRKRKVARIDAPKRRHRRALRITPPKAPSSRSVLDAIVRAFSPERPYDEQEAAFDALSGREACRHGRWPHQGGICPLCASDVAVKVCKELFGA